MYVCSNCGARFGSAGQLAGHINACYGFMAWLARVYVGKCLGCGTDIHMDDDKCPGCGA